MNSLATWVFLLPALAIGVGAAVVLSLANPAPGANRSPRRWALWLLTTASVAAAVGYGYRHLAAVIADPILVVVLMALYRQPEGKDGPPNVPSRGKPAGSRRR